METEYSYAERIADLLAHLISIATRFDGSFAELEALRDYKLFEQAVDKKLKRLWKMGKHVFITTCEEQAKAFDKTADDVSGNMNQCVIEAAKTALFIDQKISYNIDPAEDNTRDNHLSADDQRIDMSGLFVKCPGDYWEITHLNSEKSLKETGIWINPKAATGIGAEDLTVEEKRSLGNRDSFFI